MKKGRGKIKQGKLLLHDMKIWNKQDRRHSDPKPKARNGYQSIVKKNLIRIKKIVKYIRQLW